MILPDVRDAALAAVMRALAEELGLADDDPQLRERAENLLAIAIKYHVDIEHEMIGWIHYRFGGKEWSSAEFLAWSERLEAFKQEVERSHAGEESQRVCPQCYASLAQRLHESRGWWCPSCGLVVG